QEAMEAAKGAGAIVSYDLNYRPSLWKSIGGKFKAQETNTRLATLVDVMLGNEEDFTAALGFEVNDLDEQHAKLDAKNLKRWLRKCQMTSPTCPLLPQLFVTPRQPL